MPMRYRAIEDHPPMDDIDLEKIGVELGGRRQDILRVLEKECPRFDPEDANKEIDEEIAFLETTLCRFALDCDATPLRTPRKLMPAVAIAAKDPARFLEVMDRLDPESVARIIGACAARSKESEDALYLREIGASAGPPPEEIRAAAETVMAQLSMEIANGGTRRRPKVQLQHELAVTLARHFVALGGRLTRSVHDGETGPFHRILDIVVPIVQAFAHRAGFSLTVRSMVRVARQELGVLSDC